MIKRQTHKEKTKITWKSIEARKQNNPKIEKSLNVSCFSFFFILAFLEFSKNKKVKKNVIAIIGDVISL